MTKITIDEQLIALARKHGGKSAVTVKGDDEHDGVFAVDEKVILFTPDQLRSLLQAVADASYERAADGCEATALNRRAVEDWFVRKGIEHAANEIRNLKGTLPEMEKQA